MWTERQIEIMDRALELIASGGIQGLTIRNLAGKVGVSEPALYRHFPSKIDILVGILGRFEQLSKEVRAACVARDSYSWDDFEEAALSSLGIFQRKPEITSVIFAEEIFKNEPRLASKVSSVMASHHETLAGLVQKGQKQGFIRTDVAPEQLVMLLQGGIRLLVSRWRMSGYDFDLLQKGGELAGTLRKLFELSNGEVRS